MEPLAFSVPEHDPRDRRRDRVVFAAGGLAQLPAALVHEKRDGKHDQAEDSGDHLGRLRRRRLVADSAGLVLSTRGIDARRRVVWVRFPDAQPLAEGLPQARPVRRGQDRQLLAGAVACRSRIRRRGGGWANIGIMFVGRGVDGRGWASVGLA